MRVTRRFVSYGILRDLGASGACGSARETEGGADANCARPRAAVLVALVLMAFVPLACAGRTPLDAVTAVADSGGGTGTGGHVGTGGVIGTGGSVGTGGVIGTGGNVGTGGGTKSPGIPGTGGAAPNACVPACGFEQDCVGNNCITRRSLGMTCSTNQDCPSWAACCDGSRDSCNGTRLPTGDGTNAGQFEVSADGLAVSDTITGLMWQRDGSGMRKGGRDKTTCTWDEAKVYCANLILGGFSDWRLPSLRELLTIVDFTRPGPAIDPAVFPNTPSDPFWTSSPHSSPSSWVSYVDFGSGASAGCYGDDYHYRVRCVR